MSWKPWQATPRSAPLDDSGLTPLHLAVVGRSADVVRALTEAAELLKNG